MYVYIKKKQKKREYVHINKKQILHLVNNFPELIRSTIQIFPENPRTIGNIIRNYRVHRCTRCNSLLLLGPSSGLCPRLLFRSGLPVSPTATVRWNDHKR